MRMLIAAAASLWLAATLAPARGFVAEPFSRGINLAEVLAYPAHDDWPIFRGRAADPDDAELAELARLGFTFIRLPVEPGPFLEAGADRSAELLDRLVGFVRRARAVGLAVLVSPHPRPDLDRWTQAEILSDPAGPAYIAYRALIERLAGTLAELDDGALALGLMNEPQDECLKTAGPDWTELQKDLYAHVRRAAPRLTIVLTGGCWSGIDGLAHLDLEGYDRNILVDIHDYDPFAFTHQGATWAMPELRFLAGLSFPAARTDRALAAAASARLAASARPQDASGRESGLAASLQAIDDYIRSDASEASIRLDLDRAARWADRVGLPRHRLVVGEFGALRPIPESGAPDDGSRDRFLRAMREAAEELGLGWAVWAYNSPFGIFLDEAQQHRDAGMLRALGLHVEP